jgi:hypothetical protein
LFSHSAKNEKGASKVALFSKASLTKQFPGCRCYLGRGGELLSFIASGFI